MAQLAIEGHHSRGKEVIELLEMLGGKNDGKCDSIGEFAYYFINGNYIDWCHEFIPERAFICFTLEEFLEKYPYKVGDKVLYHGTDAIITQMKWDGREVIYIVKCNEELWETTVFYLQPYKEETVEENLTIQDIRDNNAEWLLNKLQEMSAEGALQTISDLYDKLRKPQYPKTYKECCEIVVAQHDRHYFYTIRDKKDYPHEIKIMDCLDNLRRLLICRDAYWKIAGEQMGLGEPWKPIYTNNNIKYNITTHRNELDFNCTIERNYVLLFPTKEIRSDFYENFKDLIEQCKELL